MILTKTHSNHNTYRYINMFTPHVMVFVFELYIVGQENGKMFKINGGKTFSGQRLNTGIDPNSECTGNDSG